MSDHPFSKVSREGLKSKQLVLAQASAGAVYWHFTLEVDANGYVDADRKHIMAATGLSKATIDRAIDILHAADMVQPEPTFEAPNRCRLLGDFVRFGPGAPTGNGSGQQKSFDEGAKKLFSPPGSSSDSESLTDLKDQDQKQLQLPAFGEKSFEAAPAYANPFEAYAQEIGEVTQFIGQSLGDWSDELGPAKVIEAIQRAVFANKKSMAYINGILKNWSDELERAAAHAAPVEYPPSSEDMPEPEPEVESIPTTDALGRERDAHDIWKVALGELQLQLPREAFDTWLRGSRLVSCEDGTYTIGVSNTYAREWLEHRMKKVIVRTLSQIAGQDVTLEVVTP